MTNYDLETKQRFGNTDAYKEYAEKTTNYTATKWQQINEGLNNIFSQFAACKDEGNSPDSPAAAALALKLQKYITDNYYTCTDEILLGLSKMYVCDECFKANIDRHSSGTAEFVSAAISEVLANA